MRKKPEYTDEPLGQVEVVEDFLPPPDRLVLREDVTKVTIGLSRSSIEFFKREAKRHRTQYQKMIRRLLDAYVARYGESPARKPGTKSTGTRSSRKTR
jgi:hypothetical protein